MSNAQSRRKQPKMETERIAHIAEQASKKSRIAYCLLSIEEIKDSDDKIIWIEMAYIDGRKIPYLRKGLLYTVRDYGVIEILSESVKVGGYIADIIRLDTRLNNLTWRCWLRKPTDEEREAMLWEEESNNAD